VTARDAALLAAADALQAAAVALREAARDPDDGPPVLLSVEEAARRLGVKRTTLYGLIRGGQVRSHRIGRRRLVSAAAVAEFASDDQERLP
jgi:excisionase family DNA binding protein